jgi:hypothetical protein
LDIFVEAFSDLTESFLLDAVLGDLVALDQRCTVGLIAVVSEIQGFFLLGF